MFVVEIKVIMKKIYTLLLLVIALLFSKDLSASKKFEKNYFHSYTNISVATKMFNAAKELPQPWYSKKVVKPETLKEREKRVKMIADVIMERTRNSKELGWYWSDNDLALATFVKTWSESGRFRYAVHSGKLRGDGGRSVCLGQIMNGGNKLVGTAREPTERCIDKVVTFLIMHQNRCLQPTSEPSVWTMSTVFAGYGTGYSCSPNVYTVSKTKSGKFSKIYWARQRAWLWWRLKNS